MKWRILVAALWIGLAACGTDDTDQAELVGMAQRATDNASVVTEADIPFDVEKGSWSRLPLPHRENMDTEGKHAFDVIVNPNSRYADGLRGPIAMLLYSPTIAKHIFPASSYLRYGTEKDPRLTELAILATTREMRSQYAWTLHELAARRALLEPQIIDLLKRRSPLANASDVPGLGDTERVIIKFVREVMSEKKVNATTFAQARELLGEKGVMDLAGLVGYYNFVNITIKSFDVQLAPGSERLLPDLW